MKFDSAEQDEVFMVMDMERRELLSCIRDVEDELTDWIDGYRYYGKKIELERLEDLLRQVSKISRNHGGWLT